MQSYFETYTKAFLTHDVNQIEPHFVYPCLIDNEAGVDVIHDADALAQHLQGFLSMLRARAVTAIDAQVHAHTQLDPHHATAVVHYALKNADGQALETYTYLYVLVKNRAGAWTIRLAELLGPNG